MAKRQDDRDPETDKDVEPSASAESTKFSPEEKLANAIESMVAANQAKSLPSHGPVPTDAAGHPKEEDCVFVERDGTKYPAILDSAYLSDRAWVKGGEDPLSGKAATFAHCVAFNIRVNYKAKKSDNWKPVHGVYQLKDLRNTHRKQYVILSPEAEKHFTLLVDAKGQIATLPDGVARKMPSK